jgi:anti-sigma B factor antagonist
MFGSQSKLKLSVRPVGETVSIIDVRGELTGAADDDLMAAYGRASRDQVRSIILNLSGLEYMNSSGIGLLVTLLVRIRRQQQRLLAYGLSEHYRQIFELTRLDEAIALCSDEQSALYTAAHDGS